MKPADEEFCKARFDEFLQKFTTPETVEWQDVDQIDEPPDYYLSLDGIKYAVEVTTLMEKFAVGSRKMSQFGIINSLWGFVDEVAETANQDGYLNGTYIVGFLDPINNFRQFKAQIRSELLDYVRTTQNMERAPEKTVIDQGGGQRCSIQKVHNLSNKIESSGPTNVKWDGEAAIQICNLIEERLATKVKKLCNISEPKILLLLDHYRFAAPQMFKNCISDLPSLASFHTVFIVRSEADNFVLHSVINNWY